MLYSKHKYSNKEFTVSPYNTLQEKDLLLLSAVDNVNLDDALKICDVHYDTISTLSKDEKIAYLYKLREISVGEEVSVNFTCTHCKTKTDNTLNISNIIKDPIKADLEVIDQYEKLTEDNIEQFINICTDDLDLEEFEMLFTRVEESTTTFNFIKPVICQACKKENKINISSDEFVIDNMSEDSLTSIYQTYNDMVVLGNYTKLDVDSFYPFERTIFLSLLNKTKEDQSNG